MPPGSAKSTYCSILFPVWYFANFPDRSIVAASHTLEFGEKWGRRNRNLIMSIPILSGSNFLPTLKLQDVGLWQARVNIWLQVLARAITGYRADLGIIDDPVKSREDADSKIMRDRAWEWYKSDFRTRLKPSGSTILIQTRWHEDDLRAVSSLKWTVVTINGK